MEQWPSGISRYAFTAMFMWTGCTGDFFLISRISLQGSTLMWVLLAVGNPARNIKTISELHKEDRFKIQCKCRYALLNRWCWSRLNFLMGSLNVPVGIPLIISFSNPYLSCSRAGMIIGMTRPTVPSCSCPFGLCLLSLCRTGPCHLLINSSK